LRNFCKQLDSLDPGACRLDQVPQNILNQGSLENVGQGNPGNECLESLQAPPDQTLLYGRRVGQSLVNDPVAEVKETGKLVQHGGLEFSCLAEKESVFAEVEEFFGEQLQNIEHVFAFVLGCVRDLADLLDEVRPGGRPLLLDDRDESAVELCKQVLVLSLRRDVFRKLKNTI